MRSSKSSAEAVKVLSRPLTLRLESLRHSLFHLVDTYVSAYWAERRELPPGFSWQLKRHMRGAPTVEMTWKGTTKSGREGRATLGMKWQYYLVIPDQDIQALLDCLNKVRADFSSVAQVMEP